MASFLRVLNFLRLQPYTRLLRAPPQSLRRSNRRASEIVHRQLTSLSIVVIHLIPQGDNTDRTRVITLRPSADPIFIGRASKTASKGLVAAPENAWFDSPIMSRQHGKISMTSSGAVQLQDLASTHGTWIRNKRLAANETRDIHDGDLITFGSTVTSGPVTYHARSFIVEFPASCGEQASPSSSTSKGSDRSGFQVPDDQYESLSDDSDAEDCKILGSHPRTFSVPSSGDEMDESDEDLHHAAAVSTPGSIASATGDALKSYRSSHYGSTSKHGNGQNPRSATKSQAGHTINQIEFEKSSRLTALFADDTEDEEAMHTRLPKEAELCKGAKTYGVDTHSSSPVIEIPDTYASLDDSKEFVKFRYTNAGRKEHEPKARGPLSEIDVSGKKTKQDEDTGYDSGNEYLGLQSPSHESEVLPYSKSTTHMQQPADLDEMALQTPMAIPSHGQATADEHESSPEPEHSQNQAKPEIGHAEVQLGRGNSMISRSQSLEVQSYSSEDESDDDCSLFSQAPSQRDAVPTMTFKANEDRSSNLSPPSNGAFVPRSHAQSNTLALPPFDLQRPTGGHTAPLDPPPPIPKYPREDKSLHPSESSLKTVRAPSPSDAALVRKASSYPTSYLATHHNFSAFEASPFNLISPEAYTFARPLRDTNTYPAPGNGFQSTSAYNQDTDDYPYLHPVTGLYDWREDRYQQGPFSRSYVSSNIGVIPSTAERWSSSPPPQTPHKSCLVKLKVDAKTVSEESQDLRPNLDEFKSKKVDISNLVNPHADGARGMKRKSDQMSSEESLEGHGFATSESSSANTVGEDDLGPHAQARDTVIAGSETISQGPGSDLLSLPISVVGNAAEQEPARKKIKMSTRKAGTVGRFVSGVCLGLAGAFAAFIAATPTDVWDEALREAVKLT
ncbi:MAG: hypothetical protein Q9199_005142 [Rusavskia elegans]